MRYAFLFIIFLLPGCISSAFSGANLIYKHKQLQEEMSDYWLNVRAWSILKKNYSYAAIQNVQLTFFHRMILLTGQVPNEETRSNILASIKSIPNIARIYNALSIAPCLSSKQKLMDSWITTKIKSKMIASNDLYADRIKVVTEQNVVYLMGIVTQQEAEIAIDIAHETEGVQRVVIIFHYMTMPEI